VNSEKSQIVDQDKDRIRARLAATVRALRTGRGLTQEELADLCDLNITAISKIERNGSLPGVETLVKLADVFEVPLDRLRDGFHWHSTTKRFAESPQPTRQVPLPR
jgi:transcriptional regulator with XRE-family HTH domain